MAVAIRKAELGDKAAVLDFCTDTFSWGDYIGDVWDRWASSGGLYVLEENGAVMGVYHLAFLDRQAWIEGMRVHPTCRRKGFGASMMHHAESVIKNGTVRLVIESENRPSLSLAKSMGYGLDEEWRLFSMLPEKQGSSAQVSSVAPSEDEHELPQTCPDSWKWRRLDGSVLEKLSGKGQILTYVENGSTLAFGIWNLSEDFPKTFQVGFVTGSKKGVGEVLKLAKNMAYSSGCDKIQVFAPEKSMLESPYLEKKSLFHLMKKELGKNL